MELLILIGIGCIAIVAVLLLKGFDRIAGRGPKQIRDGIDSSSISQNVNRMPCPECAELIMPEAKKCRFCGALIEDKSKIQEK